MGKEIKNVITEKIPEFKNIPEDWKIYSLNKVSWFQEGPGLRHWQFTTNGMKVINVTNLEAGVINLERTDRHISLDEFEKTYKHFAIDADDILMASSGATYCKTAVIAEKDLPVMMNTSVIRFKPINGIDYSFLLAFLGSFLLKRQIDFLITGGAQPNFGPAHLNQVVIPLPSIPEQKAIAKVLSTADAAIHATEKLIAQKELRKKWLMQQLLTGKKRLNGFEGEWKEVRLDQVTEKFSRRNKDLVDARVYSVTNTNGFVLQSEHFDREIAGDDLSNYKIIRKNEFAYNPARVNVGSLAYFTGEIGVISSLYVCFRTNDEILDYFLLQVLKLDHTVHKINSYGEGGVRVYLWYELFGKIKISIPSITEQIAITQVLQAADKEIRLLKAKAEKLREQKKGLMQVLLTGKVRLNIKE